MRIRARLVAKLAAVVVLAGLLMPVGIPASADNASSLGNPAFSDIIADVAHGKVFVSGGEVAFADLDGNVLGQVPGITAARQMALSPDGSTLVVANGDFLTLVDPVTAEVVENIATGPGSCPDAVAVASGLVFFTYGDCSSPGPAGLAAVDLATEVITTGLTTGVANAGDAEGAMLVSVPGAPDMLVARFGDSSSPYADDYLVVLDTTGGANPSTSVRATKTFDFWQGGQVFDFALVPDGSRVIVSTPGSQVQQEFSTSDFSFTGEYPATTGPVAVAVRDDGMVASGYLDDYDYGPSDLAFFPAGSGTAIRRVDLGKTASGSRHTFRSGGMVFGGKRLFGVTQYGSLRTYYAAPPATLTITSDKVLYGYGASARVVATLSSPTTDRTVSITAVAPDGTRTVVGSGAADAVTGRFAITVAAMKQNTTFQARFAGEDDFAPAAASRAVKVRAQVTISTASTSMKGSYHKLRSKPAPTISVGVLPSKPTSVCVKFVAQIYVSGGWRPLGSIACPKRSTSTGRYGVTMYDFLPGDRVRVQATYPTTTANVGITSAWYYVLFV